MQLQFNDLKQAELGYTHEVRWEMNKCCKAIFGGVSWPGKRPGYAVVAAMDLHRRFDSYEVCVLAEYESPSVRELVRQCDILDYTYEPKKWIGDWKNDAADKFIRELNSEKTKQVPKFSVNLTPMLEMENLYPYMLDELKRLLDVKRRMLYLKDSKVVNYLSEIEVEDIAEFKLGEYPAIEATCFAVLSMLIEQKNLIKRPKLPTKQDRSYSIGARR
ncbi:hypothetical protein LCGC14_2259820 [marine sediment metagenome]|uniref:Terminase large subunit gp17-like C-terminal domain-containing protein n=1 Tax=marine sediment metagenome TaxID=412755 RepID=A0A0F9DMF4_9ZZZZ